MVAPAADTKRRGRTPRKNKTTIKEIKLLQEEERKRVQPDEKERHPNDSQRIPPKKVREGYVTVSKGIQKEEIRRRECEATSA